MRRGLASPFGAVRRVRSLPKRSARKLAGSLQPRFTCPICQYHGPFQTIIPATGERRHAVCPNCHAAERHRLQFLVLSDLLSGTDTAGGSVLHVAPEAFFRALLQERFGR